MSIVDFRRLGRYRDRRSDLWIERLTVGASAGGAPEACAASHEPSIIGGPRRASYGASSSLRHNSVNYLRKKEKFWRNRFRCGTIGAMARPPDTTLDAAVLAAVAKHPDGASIEQIVGATKAPRRSAQRRLAALVEQGQLRATGARNQHRYHLVAARAVFEPSPAAARLRDSLAKPLAERTPVGYDAAFLESYRPNVDAYLPSAVRDASVCSDGPQDRSVRWAPMRDRSSTGF